MIQGVTYNAAQPNARVAQGETIDFADIEQKRANIEQTKAETERIKRPVEDKEAEKKKNKIFGDIAALDASGVILPDHDIAVNWINEAWDIALDPTKDLTDPATEREIYNQVGKVKYLVDKSKEIGAKASVIREKGREGNMIGSNEAVLDIFTGELPYQEQDANGNIIEKKISAKDVNSIEDYQKYLAAQTKRLSDPFTVFDTPTFLKVQEDRIQQEAKIEKDLGNGRTQTTVLTGDDKIRYNLQDLWNDKPELQKQIKYDLSQLQKNEPNKILPNGKKITEVDAREYFVESKLPTFRKKDVTLEGSEKFDTLTKIGNNKARIGNVVADYYNDGKGNWTIDMSPYNKQTKNPPLEFKKPNGQMALGTPVKWEGGDGKTPVLVINEQTTQAMRDNGSPDIIETRITYSDANQANLKYFDPYEAMQVLGVSGNQDNLSVKTPNTKPSGNKEKDEGLVKETYTRKKADEAKAARGFKTDAELIKFAKDNGFALEIK